MMITDERVDNITNLHHLPDIFEWNDEELIRLIIKQYEDSFTMERAFA